MTKAKSKRMTKAEKEGRARIRKELREKGIIPPVKPKLNRKKFAKETREEFENYIKAYGDIFYIFEAISWMTAGSTKITSEQIGALKILKLSVEIKKFAKARKAQGENSYKVMEMYEEVVKPILEL